MRRDVLGGKCDEGPDLVVDLSRQAVGDHGLGAAQAVLVVLEGAGRRLPPGSRLSYSFAYILFLALIPFCCLPFSISCVYS